jgi:hypothetical protein
MWCCQCDKELSQCTCPDLKERLERISKSPYINIGKDYAKALEKQAEKNASEKTVSE